MPNLRRITQKLSLHQDATDLLQAREEARLLHKSGDIRASGNQVEIRARHILQRRLGSRYNVAHGHMVDYRHYVSPQADIIVTGALSAPSLLETEDGTAYIPYETVLAFGEIKSTYYKTERPLEKSIETMRSIREGLFRAGSDRNPPFYFVLFVNCGDLLLQDVCDLYRGTPLNDLPTIVCWLDRGTLMYHQLKKNDFGESMPVTYLLSPSSDCGHTDAWAWALVQWGSGDSHEGANLAALIALVAQHMEHCVLSQPNIQRYITLLTAETYQLFT
jgi:hypothetical protein